MPETRHAGPYPPYDATTCRNRARVFFTRPLTAKDAIVALLAILAGLGWTVTSPAKRIDKLDARIAAAERRIDTLAEQQRFTNYLLCVQFRRTDPLAVPPDCAPIIESRTHK